MCLKISHYRSHSLHRMQANVPHGERYSSDYGRCNTWVAETVGDGWPMVDWSELKCAMSHDGTKRD